MKKVKAVILCCAITLSSVTASSQPIQIEFWNAMGGKLAGVLNTLIQRFNQTHPSYQVVNVYKGDYTALLTSLVAAFRAHQQPAIAQVLEIGTATMLAAKGATVPVQQLMQANGYPNFKTQLFLPPIGYYYASKSGELMAFPFNASSPVLYYNKDAFKKAGLDPNKPPTTWPQVEQVGKQLLKAGYSCAYTTTWPGWIQLEVFSAWQDVPFATEGNGMLGVDARAVYNSRLYVRQLATLARWQKLHLFEYGGRGDNAQSLFTSGTCAMMTQSSGSRGNLMAAVKFSLGVSSLIATIDPAVFL